MALCREFGRLSGLEHRRRASSADAPILCCKGRNLGNIVLRAARQKSAGRLVMDEFILRGSASGSGPAGALLTMPQVRFLLMSRDARRTTRSSSRN